MNALHIQVKDRAGVFAENKDKAKQIRQDEILPAVKSGARITLDFQGVELSTQSFIHALLSEAIRKGGPDVLDRIDFVNCNEELRELILTVVDYTLNPADSLD